MKNRKSNSRNFGLSTGAGKGDKSRITDIAAYRRNFDEINWGPRRVTVAYSESEKKYVVPIIYKRTI